MKSAALLIFALATLLSGTISQAQEVLTCQQHYEARNDLIQARAASDCYLSILASSPNDPVTLKGAQEGAFLSTLWIYLRSSNPVDHLEMFTRGMNLSNGLLDADPNSALGNYWNAVFITLNCEKADAGMLIPGCMMASRKKVTDQLMKAIEVDPRVHGYGPHRVYGVMMREMPPIAGGSRVESEKFLREALLYDPSYSSNYMEYAQTLRETRRNAEARVVLTELLKYDCMTMNPFHAIECREDQAEAKNLLGLSP